MVVMQVWHRVSMLIGIGAFIMAGAQFAWWPVDVGAASEQEAIRRTLAQSRHLGAHGYGYNAESLAELKQRLSPGAIPVLLDLLTHEKDVRAGAIAGLASQCGAAIEPIGNAVNRATVPFVNWGDLRNALDLIANAEFCAMADRQQALNAIGALDQLTDAEYTRRQQAAQEQRARQTELNKRGLLMLDPEGRKTVSINDCLELVWESAKAIGIDPAVSDVRQQLLIRQIENCYGHTTRSQN